MRRLRVLVLSFRERWIEAQLLTAHDILESRQQRAANLIAESRAEIEALTQALRRVRRDIVLRESPGRLMANSARPLGGNDA